VTSVGAFGSIRTSACRDSLAGTTGLASCFSRSSSIRMRPLRAKRKSRDGGGARRLHWLNQRILVGMTWRRTGKTCTNRPRPWARTSLGPLVKARAFGMTPSLRNEADRSKDPIRVEADPRAEAHPYGRRPERGRSSGGGRDLPCRSLCGEITSLRLNPGSVQDDAEKGVKRTEHCWLKHSSRASCRA